MKITPGYKQSDVGVIPQEWECQRVGNLCGCIVPGRNKPKLFDGDIPWITTPDLENGKPVTTSRLGLCVSPAEAKVVGSKVVPPGSVLMSCAGELGIVALTKNEIVVNQQLHAFLPTGCIDSAFLLNALAYRKDQIAGLGTKTAVPYLNKNGCNSIPIPLPPLPEQRAIATALGDVDALLGALDRLITKKRDLKQAAMQQLLTGQTRLPGFHGEWEVKRVDQFAPLQRGFDLPMSQIQRGDHPVVYSNGVQNRHAKFLVKAPGIVTGRSGTIGNVHFIEEDFWPHNTALWVTDFKSNDPKFVFYFLTSIGLERFGTGSGVPTLNRNDVHEFRVSVPPSPDEQTAIAEVLPDMDAELAALEQRREKTNALKQGMMQELLTGRTRLV